MATIQKNDFIEIEFTGKANNEIFDTTNKDEAKSINSNADVKPMIVAVGHNMLIKGLDDDLVGKEIGKKYSIHLLPDKAFGKRDPSLIKTIPIKVFKEKNMNPAPGMVFQFDNNLGKVISVSGGRIITDFNNQLAGKEVDYDFKILRKITDDKEKINSIQDFFFRQRFEFEIKDKKVIFKDEKLKPIIEVFKPKFKEISGFDVEIKEKVEDKKESKEEQKTEDKPKQTDDNSSEKSNKEDIK
jgi:FKBP-type peptidyl-prolyl cis-trans isomerase SlyD